MRTIEQEWNDYVKKVYPAGLKPHLNDGGQYDQVRMAFYAGHGSMFDLMNEASLQPENKAVGEVSKLREEIRAYVRSVNEKYKDGKVQ